jgi:hypothetical protein
LVCVALFGFLLWPNPTSFRPKCLLLVLNIFLFSNHVHLMLKGCVNWMRVCTWKKFVNHLQMQIPILDAPFEFQYVSVTYRTTGVPAVFFKIVKKLFVTPGT